MAKELKRLNMNMPSDLLEQVDLYADRLNVNRSAAVNMLVSMAIEQQNAMKSMEKLISEMQRLKPDDKA